MGRWSRSEVVSSKGIESNRQFYMRLLGVSGGGVWCVQCEGRRGVGRRRVAVAKCVPVAVVVWQSHVEIAE